MVECLPLDSTAQVRFPPWVVGIFLYPVTFVGQYMGPRLVFRAFRADSGTNLFNVCSGDRNITHFYCLAVKAGFNSDVVECLPLDPSAQVRFPPRRLGFFYIL